MTVSKATREANRRRAIKHERERDARDLRILQLLDQGYTQQQVADAFGMTRGPISRMMTEISRDEAAR